MDKEKARETLGDFEGHGLLSKERADEICDAWGVKPVDCDVKWKSKKDAASQGLDWVASDSGEAVWDLSLLKWICWSLEISDRTPYIGRGREARELVGRLVEYLKTGVRTGDPARGELQPPVDSKEKRG